MNYNIYDRINHQHKGRGTVIDIDIYLSHFFYFILFDNSEDDWCSEEFLSSIERNVQNDVSKM